ncbi:MAG: type II secretion system minor pseudopilin GspK [Proteobacteria bacterium]|nr:type II secretion system minor pseudopilin GspK [Pseudomonadota bacterium]
MLLSTSKRQSGIVLALVLILAMVLSTAVITFLRRAVIDSAIVHNRDAVAQAEALARGGVRLATALLLEDLANETLGAGTGPGETLQDVWARVGKHVLMTQDGAELRLEIRDVGARLNLNALIDHRDPNATPEDDAQEFLVDLFDKVIDEIPLPPGEKFYDSRELAENLLDYMDPNDLRIRGGRENDYYGAQDPPYRAADRPLLSIEELRMVEGFDAPLVDALRDYVTVYPLVGGSGINLNTAPEWVLASVYHGNSGDRRLADEDVVRKILRIRDEGGFVCDRTESAPDRCTQLLSARLEGSIYPPTTLPARADFFRVEAEARVGEIVRTVEAVVDRSLPTEARLLSWRVR